MCTAETLTHHRHAAETTLPLITAAATQRRSLCVCDGKQQKSLRGHIIQQHIDTQSM